MDRRPDSDIHETQTKSHLNANLETKINENTNPAATKFNSKNKLESRENIGYVSKRPNILALRLYDENDMQESEQGSVRASYENNHSDQEVYDFYNIAGNIAEKNTCVANLLNDKDNESENQIDVCSDDTLKLCDVKKYPGYLARGYEHESECKISVFQKLHDEQAACNSSYKIKSGSYTKDSYKHRSPKTKTDVINQKLTGADSDLNDEREIEIAAETEPPCLNSSLYRGTNEKVKTSFCEENLENCNLYRSKMVVQNNKTVIFYNPSGPNKIYKSEVFIKLKPFSVSNYYKGSNCEKSAEHNQELRGINKQTKENKINDLESDLDNFINISKGFYPETYTRSESQKNDHSPIKQKEKQLSACDKKQINIDHKKYLNNRNPTNKFNLKTANSNKEVLENNSEVNIDTENNLKSQNNDYINIEPLSLCDSQPSPLLQNTQQAPLIQDTQPTSSLKDKQHTPLLEDKQQIPLLKDKQHTPLLEDKQPAPLLEDKQPTPLLEEPRQPVLLQNTKSEQFLKDTESTTLLQNTQLTEQSETNEEQGFPTIQQESRDATRLISLPDTNFEPKKDNLSNIPSLRELIKVEQIDSESKNTEKEEGQNSCDRKDASTVTDEELTNILLKVCIKCLIKTSDQLLQHFSAKMAVKCRQNESNTPNENTSSDSSVDSYCNSVSISSVEQACKDRGLLTPKSGSLSEISDRSLSFHKFQSFEDIINGDICTLCGKKEVQKEKFKRRET